MSFTTFEGFYRDLSNFGMSKWALDFKQALTKIMAKADGNRVRWLNSYNRLPDILPSKVNFASASIEIGVANDLDGYSPNNFKQILQELHPWRKGPYKLFDIFIDSEWKSDLKWNRLKNHISSLKGKRVIDIGCGNGYHLWKMLENGASFVLGIDPSFLFLTQFEVIKKYLSNPPVHILPLGIEDVPSEMKSFDVIFSMGVLYHRKSPFDFLKQLKSLMKKGGELILETMIVDGDENTVLVPRDRYSQMRNVWFIPSVLAVELWLSRVGFTNIRTIDVTKTTTDEQRKTEWMRNNSLASGLNREDSSLTIEGYPAPKRAITLAMA